MHPRNRYLKNPADFGELAESRPSLRPYLISKRKRQHRDAHAPSADHAPTSQPGHAYTLDFSNPAAVRELTCAVLERDFDLRLEIPVDRLIPTVPQKLNYIHWLEDLLAIPPGGVANTQEGVACSKDHTLKGRNIIGVDVGTGVSCIYPLLGSRLNNWRFLATDVAVDTVRFASENVARNGLQEDIEVKLVSKESMLKDVVDPSVPHYSFSMCNPPFFRSEGERLGVPGGGSGDRRPPASTFSGGSVGEMVTEGGEVEFVKRMIAESVEMRGRIRWYTSMLGKKSSLKVLLSELKRHQVPVVTTTEFVQGKTWRWGIAWSFDETLKDKVEELRRNERKRRHTHPPSRLVVRGRDDSTPPASPEGIERVKQWLEEILAALEISHTTESRDSSVGSCDPSSMGSCDSSVTMWCVAQRVTWTHQRRKRRLLERLKDMKRGGETADSEVLFEELERKTKAEIESLCVPCQLEFSAHLGVQTSGAGSSSKRRVSGKEGRSKESVCLELDLVGEEGERELLNQLLQYLQNKMQIQNFQ